MRPFWGGGSCFGSHDFQRKLHEVARDDGQPVAPVLAGQARHGHRAFAGEILDRGAPGWIITGTPVADAVSAACEQIDALAAE